MRKPYALSQTALKTWRSNRERFYLERLADVRMMRDPQTRPQSVGSAFDAIAKSHLHKMLFGKSDPAYELDTLFEKQVEPQNRDWARPAGQHVFDSYLLSGAWVDLWNMLRESDPPPQFEFTVTKEIGGVPFIGIPDCRFVWHGIPIILDWKVAGFCSTASPSKGYMLCRDGWTPWDAPPSRSNNMQHKSFVPTDWFRLRINSHHLERADLDYARQMAIYGWLMGETPGNDDFVAQIDELVCKQSAGPMPLIRVATHRARIGHDFQMGVLAEAADCWRAITSGHIFADMPRDESDARCYVLEQAAQMSRFGQAECEFPTLEQQLEAIA